MKTITLTKSEIQQALATENLIAGRFFVVNNSNTVTEDCRVCAVGAALKKHFKNTLTTTAIEAALNIVDDLCLSSTSNVEVFKADINSALRAKNYLGALSMYHESLCELASAIYPFNSDYASSDEHRFYLIDFVEAHFPKVIKIELESSYDLG